MGYHKLNTTAYHPQTNGLVEQQNIDVHAGENCHQRRTRMGRTNTATITRPEEEPLLVAIERLRRCPDEIGPGFWPADGRRKKNKKPGEAVDRHQSEVSRVSGWPCRSTCRILG